MYEFLRGKIVELGDGWLVLDTGPVGYHLLVSRQTATACAIANEAQLLTHYHVTESSQALFGFASPAERALFRRLLQVNGVGPSSALGLLSAMPPDQLARTILDEDLKALTSIKGVGKKTAERLVIELRDHLGELAAPQAGLPGGGVSASGGDELAQVLMGLGSAPREAQKLAAAAREALGPQADFQELLRHALHAVAID
ncbi:MAG: Holliday junction branch migration protein RuvA [Planctomycetes bacterium]|nr:Holliday junction branch migration protein RuvA [Planctomycetota bacterium]